MTLSDRKKKLLQRVPQTVNDSHLKAACDHLPLLIAIVNLRD